MEKKMSEVISLDKYRASLQEKKLDNEINFLKTQVDSLLERLEDIEPQIYPDLTQTVMDTMVSNNQVMSPSESALLNAYYTLMYEKREDLADLVLEILKMK